MSLQPHIIRSIENLLHVEDVHVVKILGQGSFGMALLIDAPALIKPLVVKLFQSEDGFYTCFREYVLQDNFAVLGLAPPVVGVALNVVTGKTSSAFIIMEQVDGTLYELLHQSQFSYSLLVNIAKELIMMVDTACAHALTHADLHLHNIGYKHANNYLKFLFLDFGLTVSKCTNVLVDLLALITMTFKTDIEPSAMDAALVLRQEFIKEFKKRASPMRWPQDDDKYGWDTVHIDTRNAYGVKGLKHSD